MLGYRVCAFSILINASKSVSGITIPVATLEGRLSFSVWGISSPLFSSWSENKATTLVLYHLVASPQMLAWTFISLWVSTDVVLTLCWGTYMGGEQFISITRFGNICQGCHTL